MSEEIEETIIVTGRRLSDGGTTSAASGSGGVPLAATILSFSQQPKPDAFQQEGGEENVITTSFAMIDGNVIVRLPGYDFPIKVPAATWDRMSDTQKGALIKLFTEFSQSAHLVQFLNHLQNQGVSEVEIHYDDRMHKLDGTTGPFQMSDSPEGLQWQSIGGDETDLVAGTKVIITINSDIVTSGKEFAELVIHALGHPYQGIGSDDEAWLLTREGTIYDEIFSTPGERETSPQDYYEGRTIVGSRHGDNITGSARNDTLSGLSGNDVLNGGGGNDLVMGGAGMDWLSGGQGNNMVAGGLDADTYVPVVDAGMDYIVEMGGVDRIDLSAHDMGSCHFYRSGNTLNISLPSGALIVIENQWVAGSKVEQFVFAHGTVASSYIEYLADNNAGSGSGLCYDEYGRQIMCSPYGLPIVFDLDGDGIELVSIDRSHARFDLDGDGAKDRLGWVAPDDGILALDRDGNGRIDNFDEISFVHDFLGAASDLEGLYAYDTDRDGFLTATDDRFGEFLIWRDSNGNGKSEKHELFTLGEMGIVSVALERRDLNPLRPEDEMNQILAKSVFVTADGVSRQVGDVALFVDMSGQDCGCHNRRELLALQGSALQLDGLIP